MNAQMLYDLRSLTGFVSGTELHDMFSRLLGEPSPSGKQVMDIMRLKEDPVGKLALDLLDRKLWHAIDDIATYVGI